MVLADLKRKKDFYKPKNSNCSAVIVTVPLRSSPLPAQPHCLAGDPGRGYRLHLYPPTRSHPLLRSQYIHH